MNAIDRIVGYGIDRVAFARAAWKAALARTGALPPYLSADLGSLSVLDAAFGDDDQTRHQALAVSWIYAAIRLLAQEVSAADLGVYRRQGESKKEVVNHPLEVLLDSPNDHMTGSFLWQYTIWWMQLRGKAYWYLAPSKNDPDEILEIWPIQADRMTPLVGKTKFVERYVYRTKQGKSLPIPPQYIVFFRYPHPFNLWDGLAPLTAAGTAMATDSGTAQWQRETYTAGRGIPHSIISLDKNLSDRDLTVATARIREDFEEGRKVAIARGGDIDVKNVGISPRELDLVRSREFTRDEIDIIFLGTPLHAVTTESGIAVADKVFKEKTVHPLHVLMAGQLTTQLVVPFYEDDLIVEFEDIRPQDRSLDIQEFNIYKQAMTFDEARDKIGLKPFKHETLAELGGLPLAMATDPNFVLQVFGSKLTGGETPPTEAAPSVVGESFPTLPALGVGSGTPSLPESDTSGNLVRREAGRGVPEEKAVLDLIERLDEAVNAVESIPAEKP